MQSLKYLYKAGRGPSSSHTMGPDKAARYFKEKYADAVEEFYGKYNEAYAIKLSSTLVDIPAVETSYYIDEIFFSFPTLEILIFVLN